MKVLRVLRRQKGGSDFGEWELEMGGRQGWCHRGGRGHICFMILFKVLTSVISYVSLRLIFLVTFTFRAEALLIAGASFHFIKSFPHQILSLVPKGRSPNWAWLTTTRARRRDKKEMKGSVFGWCEQIHTWNVKGKARPRTKRHSMRCPGEGEEVGSTRSDLLGWKVLRQAQPHLSYS